MIVFQTIESKLTVSYIVWPGIVEVVVGDGVGAAVVKAASAAAMADVDEVTGSWVVITVKIPSTEVVNVVKVSLSTVV